MLLKEYVRSVVFGNAGRTAMQRSDLPTMIPHAFSKSSASRWSRCTPREPCRNSEQRSYWLTHHAVRKWCVFDARHPPKLLIWLPVTNFFGTLNTAGNPLQTYSHCFISTIMRYCQSVVRLLLSPCSYGQTVAASDTTSFANSEELSNDPNWYYFRQIRQSKNYSSNHPWTDSLWFW